MTAKKCTKCQELKPFSLFHRDNQKIDNLTSQCKDCINKASIEYKRSKNGIISQIYNTQKYNSTKRGDVAPDYSLSELRKWALRQPIFHTIYKAWLESGYSFGLSPSFDRINDYLPYTFNNITIMTWRDNCRKSHQDKRNGINNKSSKPVSQMTADGEFVKNHCSASLAGRELGIDQSAIIKCCRKTKHRNTAGGYKWEYSK